MTSIPSSEVSQLLAAVRGGDDQALERLCELLQAQLRELAESLMRRERPGITTQPSDLVQSVLLHLLQDGTLGQAPNRAYLFGAAGKAMRRLLVDHARRRKADKRGGGVLKRTPLDEVLDGYESRSIDLVALDEALGRLRELHPRQHRVVDEYHFGGFSMREIAGHLGVSEATVCTDFRRAQQWLAAQLREGEP
jgi:RNA polymerase sigma factor (TIGR02999 family)